MDTRETFRCVGLISGTSMDGIDAALVEFENDRARLVEALSQPYDQHLRDDLEALKQSCEHINLDHYGQLDRRVGLAFADAAVQVCARADVGLSALDAIGSHGQTVRHRTDVAYPFTIQLGDPNTIAARTGVTTVADFRRRDIAHEGEGAPLAPAFHRWLLGPGAAQAAVLNLGGIANLTIPNGRGGIVGFDTGPASTLLDAWARRELDIPYDAGGAIAKSGRINAGILARLVADPYFARPAPKSTGFEYFNLAWLDERIGEPLATESNADVLATLTELTATTIASALRESSFDCGDLYVCGGGAHNEYLLERIRRALPAVTIRLTTELGIGPDWIEAAAFAWLARETLAGRPGNLRSVTGARREAILGAIYPANLSAV